MTVFDEEGREEEKVKEKKSKREEKGRFLGVRRSWQFPD
jgi:hypothetical protein